MSFLKSYMLFTSGNEVPENYHFWSGVSALSAVVNRRVWLGMGLYNLYPNLYVVLLGQPGNGKSLAMDTSADLVDAIGDVNFSGDAQTKESLVRYMRDECVQQLEMGGELVNITPITIYATELSHLLGPNSGHMIDFLTTIYTKDHKYVTRTKNKGDDIIERPFLSLIACTTQEWITTYLKSDIIGGGFTRRVIFVNEPPSASIDDKSKRRPFVIVTPEQEAAKQACITYAQTLKTVKGSFGWSPDAKLAYETWYNTRDIPKDPDTAGYFKTKPNQVLKVAMLISLSESPDLILRKSHFDVAMALLEKTEVTLTRVFQGIGRNELNAVANKAVEYLFASPERDYQDGTVHKRARFIEEKRLRGLLYRDAPGRELNDVLDHLKNTNKVFTYVMTTGGVGRVLLGLQESISIVPAEDKTS